MTRCLNCAALARPVAWPNVRGKVCPICLVPVTRPRKPKKTKRRRALVPDTPTEFDRADPGNPLGHGMPLGRSLRLDGESHRQGWMRVLRADPCSYCGSPVSGTVDHIVPQAARIRGVHSWTNYTGSCESCNASKAAKNMLLFLATRARSRQRRAA